MDESFADQQPFFARVTEAAFWVDKERVQVLIDLYQHHQSLWNMKSAQYKNVLIKKKAKDDIRKHFGLTGCTFFCYVIQVYAVFCFVN